jgi:putative CocE/NonD family hydrolase
MDSTDHENYHLELLPITAENDHDSNDEALARMLPSYIGPALDFYDRYLLGRNSVRIPPVRWHHGFVGWRSAEEWPPPGSREVRLFLRAGSDGGGLSAEPDGAAGAVTWTHDPGDLVPSTISDPFAFLSEYPDERSVSRRDDVLTFTTEELDAPLDLTGPVSASLGVTSTAPTSALFAKLIDVFPDGSRRMLQRGQALVTETSSGQPTEVAMGHLGYRVQPGHRLGLQIASSDFPLYLWHPGTRENPWTATSWTPSEQRLGTGGVEESFLSLWTGDPP